MWSRPVAGPQLRHLQNCVLILLWSKVASGGELFPGACFVLCGNFQVISFVSMGSEAPLLHTAPDVKMQLIPLPSLALAPLPMYQPFSTSVTRIPDRNTMGKEGRAAHVVGRTLWWYRGLFTS